MLHHNVGILFSQSSRNRYCDQALSLGQTYRFAGAEGEVTWLREEYAYLAVNGTSTVLRRLGVKHDVIGEDDLTRDLLSNYHVLFVPNAQYPSNQAVQLLMEWATGTNILVVSGKTGLPAELLGLSESRLYRPRGFTGMKWTSGSRAESMRRPEYVVTSAPGYQVNVVRAQQKATVVGQLYEFSGDLTTVDTADKWCLNGDATVVTQNSIYFAQQIFEYIGAMLQGHVNIEVIRGWGNRHNYVEVLVSLIKRVLQNFGCARLWDVQLRPWGAYDGVVVLRHDVDHSDDTTYLAYEIENNIPATYAITLEKHRRTWLAATTKAENIESCFHFYTTPPSELVLHGSRLVDDMFGTSFLPTLAKGLTTGKGLFVQIRRAERKHGIKSVTAQRHHGLFFYPEIIDAMDYLYEHDREMLGLGTMFRFTNLRYGKLKVDGEESYIVQHPDVSVPFWFPFKMVVTSVERHKILRGWDLPHAIEPDPPLVDALLGDDGEKRNCPVLENGVFTFGFHPAHCHTGTFNPGGNWEWFVYAVRKAKERNYWLANCKMVYEKMNDWEDLVLGTQDDHVVLHNPANRDIHDVVLRTKHRLVGAVSSNSDCEITILGHMLPISTIRQGQTVELSLRFD